jgi:hypothetical protein
MQAPKVAIRRRVMRRAHICRGPDRGQRFATAEEVLRDDGAAIATAAIATAAL